MQPINLPPSAFRSKKTREFAGGKVHRKLRHIETQLKRSLVLLANAANIRELKEVEPSLHPLKNHKWEFAINLTSKYRLCFDWNIERPDNIEVTSHYDPI